MAWQSEVGQFDGAGASVSWQLADARVDRRYTATARIELDGADAGTCSLGVWVVSRDASPGGSTSKLRGEFIARRGLLRPADPGEAGFGLYSYFLMRVPTDDSAKRRQAAVVRTLIDLLPAVTEQEFYLERSKLNRAYLPVTILPPADLAAPLANWLLDHYDYERAKTLLSLYPNLTGEGPFVIAVPRLLRGPVTPLLTWNLGGLDDSGVADGVARFLNQSAQLYDWGRGSAFSELRDRLLTAVAGMFVGRSAAQTWLQLTP